MGIEAFESAVRDNDGRNMADDRGCQPGSFDFRGGFKKGTLTMAFLFMLSLMEEIYFHGVWRFFKQASMELVL